MNVNRTSRLQLISSFLLISAVLLTGMLMHEMWRDEMQAILIAKSSNSISDLFQKTSYEGHGILWYLLIWPVISVFQNPFSIQMLHAWLAIAAVFIILFRSPFRPWIRILAVSGYFFIYEYAVISRHYVLTVLIILLFCSMENNRRREIGRTFLMVLLPHTGIYAILCMPMLLMIHFKELTGKKMIIHGAIVLASSALAIFKLLTPSDAGFAEEWFFGWDWVKFQRAIEIVYEAMIPLPETRISFWGSNFLDFSPHGVMLKPLLALFFMLYFFLVFRKDRMILYGIFTGIVALIAFTYCKYEGFLRHYGHIWLMFFAGMWIYRERYGFTRGMFLSFTFLLLLHLVSAGIALSAEIRFPFSGAEEAADFIRKENLKDKIISADTDFIGVPVSAYLSKEIYYPQAFRSGTYIILDTTRSRLIEFDEVKRRTLATFPDSSRILFLLDYEPDTMKHNIRRIYSGPETIVPDERYFIYVLK